jgi:hypothetical protein
MGSGGGAPQLQKVESTTTNLPKYLEPYVTDIASRAQAESNREYTPYEGQRIAGFTPEQQQVQQNVVGLQQPGQFGQATDFATQAGLGSLAAGNYDPASFSYQNVAAPNLQQYQMGTAQTSYAPGLQAFQMQGPGNVSAQQYAAPTMGTARTGYNPNLQDYQMSGPEQFGQAQAQQYMSPYAQNVMDVQKREAITDAQKAQLMTNLGAARQGTYGGARQLLAGTERERALGQNLSDIQTKGLQAAYENAQAQFERDRAAGMTAGQQNLQARLQTQQLGTQTGLQTALANLSSEQQANVQNQAAQLQTQGLNADQALRAALANQQTGFNVGQQNLQSQLGVQQLGANIGAQTALANLSADQQARVQNLAAQLQTQGLSSEQALRAAMSNQQYGMEAQRLSEASRQFGSSQGLQSLAQALQSAQTLGNLGQTQQQMDLQRLQAQDLTAAQMQQMNQKQLDLRYQDFINQRDDPRRALDYYSNLVRGLPNQMGYTQTTSASPPSMASQIGGLGIGALSLAQLYGGK